jgi:hypothetical protein
MYKVLAYILKHIGDEAHLTTVDNCGKAHLTTVDICASATWSTEARCFKMPIVQYHDYHILHLARSPSNTT